MTDPYREYLDVLAQVVAEIDSMGVTVTQRVFLGRVSVLMRNHPSASVQSINQGFRERVASAQASLPRTPPG